MSTLFENNMDMRQDDLFSHRRRKVTSWIVDTEKKLPSGLYDKEYKVTVVTPGLEGDADGELTLRVYKGTVAVFYWGGAIGTNSIGINFNPLYTNWDNEKKRLEKALTWDSHLDIPKTLVDDIMETAAEQTKLFQK